MMHRAETMRCGACSNFIPARSRRAPKRGFCRLAGHNTCVSESTRVCAVDEQCAACAEECGVNDGTLLRTSDGAGGEERTEGETETPSWLKAAYEAGPEHYDTVLDRGLSAIGREVMDIANRHKKDLPLVIAVLRLTIAPLERHMTDEGQAMLQWILRNAAAVDLTDAQK